MPSCRPNAHSSTIDAQSSTKRDRVPPNNGPSKKHDDRRQFLLLEGIPKAESEILAFAPPGRCTYIWVFEPQTNTKTQSIARNHSTLLVFMKRFLPWLIGLAVLFIRITCRFRVHGDVRDRLQVDGTPHVFAALHAHQVAAGMAANRGTCAMVSRSADGQFIVPALKLLGHIPIRGSAGNNATKGGASALHSMVKYVQQGHPAILAVDGPRGPRGTVHKGIGMLARKSDAAVLAVIVIPKRRWILSKTWDRLQIPKPFTTLDAYLAPPLYLGESEKLEEFAQRVESAIRQLEQQHDPAEASPVECVLARTKQRTTRAQAA